jgi:rhomboid family protein
MLNLTSPSDFMRRTPVMSNLIVINVVMLLATYTASRVFDIDLVQIFGLHYPESEYFRPWQLVTYMFMHSGLSHLFFNMFSLWMFGQTLEVAFGSKRFLFYYLFTGLGAMSLHLFVLFLEIAPMQRAANEIIMNYTPEAFGAFMDTYFPGRLSVPANTITNATTGSEIIYRCIHGMMDVPTVGASGAVYGILLAFGVLFPNVRIFLLFPPIPLKAKWFVVIFALIEVYLGFMQPGSSVAHFAHVGGMLFGFLLLLHWKRNGTIRQYIE